MDFDYHGFSYGVEGQNCLTIELPYFSRVSDKAEVERVIGQLSNHLLPNSFEFVRAFRVLGTKYGDGHYLVLRFKPT